MLTQEFYTILEEIDSLLNNVFYRTCQLRDLGKFFLNCPTVIDVSQAGCYITDYCVPSVTELSSLQESLDALKTLSSEAKNALL